jgi:CheY-like chemotaxis protein
VSASALRVLICDDDPSARAMVRLVAEERGDVVIAETEQANEAIDLFERFHPDVLVLDLALRWGAGADVIDAVRRSDVPCAIVVFTAFAGSDVEERAPVVAVVEKPGFDRLGDVLGELPSRTTASAADRRRWEDRTAGFRRGPGVISDPAPEFYAALADACPGDALLMIRPSNPIDLAVLGPAVRKTLRAQDWMLVQPRMLVALLVGGNPAAVPSVRRRLPPLAADCEVYDAVIGDSEEPADALLRLTHQPV